MGKLLLILLFFTNFVLSLLYPWIGVCLGYFFNILGPQFIWWWVFEGVRPFFLISIPVIIGFFLGIIRGTINFEVIKNKYVFFVVLYFLFVILSYWLGPYVHVVNRWRFFDSYKTLNDTIKIFVFFFIALCCISDERKLKFFSLALAIAVFYLIYWANMQYFTRPYVLRLRGPTNLYGSGIYNDQNVFSMVFVTGLPFLFYLGLYYKKWLIRGTCWLAIPFGWHAIFLTGSRGGLLGVVITIIFTSIRLQKKMWGLVVISSFIIAYMWQGGSVLKERAKTITSYEKESSAEARLQSWKAGLKMIKVHPFTGVGIASYGQAFPDYSDREPCVAHNTVIQIAAESGLPAGLCYLFFMLGYIRELLKCRRSFSEESFCFFMSDAVLVSMVGFLVCSLFLTLNLFEIQFYLIVLANSIMYLSKKTSDML